ncbi:MAG: hypothetical protein HY874_12380 [Chloroflexi bacterium]|nr:hypothetical protein [Chloroflexota bacterium]
MLSACGGGGSKTGPSDAGKPAAETDISGTYLVVQDSDGTKPKAGATVTLVLDKGTLSVHAVAGDEELNDTGTYSIRDGRMTIEFIEQQLSATDQPYSFDGETLEIPLRMFGEGPGSSTWKRTDGQAAAKASPTAAAAAALKGDWGRWDLKKDAGAAATKNFVAAVNEKGTTWTQAVKDAAAFAKTLPDVADATVSPNGLNITIRYKDGTGDYVVTERMDLAPAESAAIDASPSERLVSAQPVGAGLPQPVAPLTTAGGCAALPGSVAASPRAPEPGREGLNPAGGFGVSLYSAPTQPKPITSADTPPKRALLVAPAYELPHPLRGHGGKVVVYESFKSAVGPSIECMQSDLEGAGYTVDTILGKEESGKSVHTGDQAIDELAKFLTANKYGVFYVMSHGTNIDHWYSLQSQSWMYMGLLDISRPELKQAVNGRKISPAVNADIVKALVTMTGLTWDGSGDAPFVVGAEFDGSAVVWITPAFFQMMRDQKAVSFDKAMVFLNTCSSGAGSSLKDAFKARAFFGWAIPMYGAFVGRTAETILDATTDHARSARGAWWMWRRHEAWQIEQEGKARDDNQKPEQLKASGGDGEEYTPITSQSVILIYRLRHGPSSASSDIAGSLLMVKSCSELFWSAGKKTGLASPACHQLEFGNQLPSNDEVDDAVFEVGGPVTKPFGRWTLAD